MYLSCLLSLHERTTHASYLRSAAYQLKNRGPHLHQYVPPCCPLFLLNTLNWVFLVVLDTGLIPFVQLGLGLLLADLLKRILSSYLCSLGVAAVVVSATAWSATLVSSIVYRRVHSHVSAFGGCCPAGLPEFRDEIP